MVEIRLESILILSCENDVKIGPDKVIDNFAMKSGVMSWKRWSNAKNVRVMFS